MDATGFERLTEGQKECLRLFHARFEVKDIARRIGRSPVTVHQRLAAARKHLGVDRSVEAARLLFEHERDEPDREGQATLVVHAETDGFPTSPDSGLPQSPHDTSLVQDGQRSEGYRSPIYGATMMAEPTVNKAVEVAEKPTIQGLPLPIPTRDRPVNDMGLGAKLIYVVVLAALIALVFGGMVAALNGLSELF